MSYHIHIKNFKCFYDIKVPLSNLTVLAGGNGNGKSSVIQALLLLRRTVEHCGIWHNDHFEYQSINGLNVELNGVYGLSLGNSLAILPSEFTETEVELGFGENERLFNVIYDTNAGNEIWITPKKIKDYDFKYPHNALMTQQFYYLNAERIGPRISQGIKSYEYPNVGIMGEYTAQIIADIDSLDVQTSLDIDKDRILNDERYLKGNKFQHHINAWLSYILDGVTIEPMKDTNTHTARIVVESSYSKGKPIFPTNTGFGISYSLPIIVSCLLAEKDRFLIIENPEAHLHPAAQSKMGYFLGVMANAGIRIIMETHSDHIINGLQIAVAKKMIAPKKVIINYFYKDEKTETVSEIRVQPLLKSIQMNAKGELSKWPKGFFDQTQIDFANLLKLRKNV